MKRFRHIYWVPLLLLAACKPSADDGKETAPEVMDAPQSAEVDTLRLEMKPFAYELVSNGKVAAPRYADLRFDNSSAPVVEVPVRNGQHVAKGQVVAVMDKFKLESAVANARQSFDRAEVEMADALIGQGYDPEKPGDIPPEVMRLARLRSGTVQAEIQLREAEHALRAATLKAPFDGIVANLEQKEGNFPDMSKPVARIIASSAMEVEFPVLESELSLIKTGDAVNVTPYAGTEVFTGRISAINPVVDKDGLVKVTATLGNSAGLFDGMNARVTVRRETGKALVVPKSAVVLRSGGRQVVFTYSDGKAFWNYVTVSLENMDEYVVTDGLQPGQTVIVSGNLNLAHEAPVTVKPVKEQK